MYLLHRSIPVSSIHTPILPCMECHVHWAYVALQLLKQAPYYEQLVHDILQQHGQAALKWQT